MPGGDVDYTLILYAQDNMNNINSVTRTFGIRTNSPAITLDNPTSNQFINRLTNIGFNFTATKVEGINACQLWINSTGLWQVNQTIFGITSGVQKAFSSLNLSEQAYNWTVWCNDSLGNGGYAYSNNTFTLDITKPKIIVDAPTTSAGSSIFTFNTNATDTNLDYCKYTVTDRFGNIILSQNNVTAVCNSSTPATIGSTFDVTYNLTVTAFDKAGNINATTQSFTIGSAPSNPPSGGGGGSTTIIIAQTGNWTMKTLEGADKYTLLMSPGNSREKYIVFNNLGAVPVNLTLNCTGDLCNYITLNSTSLLIPIGIAIPTSLVFSVDLPNNITNTSLLANIKATDTNFYSQIITVETSISLGGDILSTVSKSGETTLIFGIPIPNLLIGLPIALILSIIIFFIIPEKLKMFRAGIVFIVFIISYVTVILLLP